MSDLIPIEYKNQRILTTQQVADGYEASTDKIKQNYNNNKERYLQGIHYFILEGEELKQFKNGVENFDLAPNINRFFLWTEKGCFLHAKSLSTDKAWDVYNELVDTYFRVKQIEKPQDIEDLIIMQAQSMKQLKAEVKQLSATVQTVKDTIVTQPDNWREDMNRMFNKIVETIGGDKFQELRTESYNLLESRAHVDLERRLNNHRGNLFNAGANQTIIKKANKLDVIEQDPKLREIYASIVKEYSIKYCA